MGSSNVFGPKGMGSGNAMGALIGTGHGYGGMGKKASVEVRSEAPVVMGSLSKEAPEKVIKQHSAEFPESDGGGVVIVTCPWVFSSQPAQPNRK